VDLDPEPGANPRQKCAQDGGKLSGREVMLGASFTEPPFRKAPSEMLALKPYRGKPAVRNFRGGDGDVGIIRSPVRAIALLDHSYPQPVNITYLLRAPGRPRANAATHLFQGIAPIARCGHLRRGCISNEGFRCSTHAPLPGDDPS
jgi:hypothetical protein